MFTGIVESLGKVIAVEEQASNKIFWVEWALADQLKVDQSVAHNGVCLTVIAIHDTYYKVQLVAETLKVTTMNHIKQGDYINIERCMLLNSRLDGHLVQGHIDGTAICKQIIDCNGSWLMHFELENKALQNLMVTKGSITINGVSLTLVSAVGNSFSVAIIPYTFNHTTFQYLKPYDTVNIEMDIIGKYVAKMIQPIL
jgi:riboflavin synthase